MSINTSTSNITEGYISSLIGDSIKKGLEEACKPENIARILQESAAYNIRNVIEHTITDFFWYGKGNKLIKEAVEEILGKREG